MKTIFGLVSFSFKYLNEHITLGIRRSSYYQWLWNRNFCVTRYDNGHNTLLSFYTKAELSAICKRDFRSMTQLISLLNSSYSSHLLRVDGFQRLPTTKIIFYCLLNSRDQSGRPNQYCVLYIINIELFDKRINQVHNLLVQGTTYLVKLLTVNIKFKVLITHRSQINVTRFTLTQLTFC